MMKITTDGRELEFCLGDVLSIISGRNLSPEGMLGVHRILSYMAGQYLHTDEMKTVGRICSSILKLKFPQLSELDPELRGDDEVNNYLKEMIQIYGNSFIIPLINKELKNGNITLQ